MSEKIKHGKVTLYINTGLGVRKIEAKEFEYETGVKYAQYDNATRFQYKKPRQRKWRGGVESSHASLVVLDGWGHFNPDDPLTEERQEGAFAVRTSRFTMFSPEYGQEFDGKLKAYLERSGATVLLDLRGVNPHNRFHKVG